MALSIQVNNGIFEMTGNLTACNVEQVFKYFEIILKMNERIKINLGNLDSIDMSGILKLKVLALYAKRNGLSVSFLSTPKADINKSLYGSGITLSSLEFSKFSA